MNIFAVARSRDNKYEFFAYVISQKRSATLRKKLQSSVSQVKRSPHTKIQLFLSTLKMAKKSRGRSCPRPFNYLFKRQQMFESCITLIINISISDNSPVVVDSHSNMCKVSSYRGTRQPRYQWQTPQYQGSK